jgi:cytoskeletal protein CcmA (bactofilin family)
MGENHNLIINGSGSYGGGIYHKIKIRGDGTITSDLECEEFKVYGSSNILQNAGAKKFTVYGETEVRGDVDAQEMRIIGNTAIGGKAAIKKVKVWGTLDIGGKLSGDEADIKGSLAVKGDADFERFRSTGSFEIRGLLNAGAVKINLRFGMSRADEIGGETIIVKRKLPLFSLFTGEGYLTSREIEGDEIFLENTKADVVRGKRITIGEGCEIGKVEYKEEFAVNGNAVVKEYRKME